MKIQELQNSNFKSNIALTGLTAAGKTTHSLISSAEFGFTYFSASNIVRSKVGLSTDYPPDFWTSDQGIALVRQVGALDIDETLVESEQTMHETIFDCRSLPWLSRNKILSIWLKSSIESRVNKALVSYENSSTKSREEVYSLLQAKDDQDRKTFKDKFNFDLFKDYQVMDVVLDISPFSKGVSKFSAWESIQQSQDIISMIIGLYLTHHDFYRHRLTNMRQEMSREIFCHFSKSFEEIISD
jgi:cytidylate kinase